MSYLRYSDLNSRFATARVGSRTHDWWPPQVCERPEIFGRPERLSSQSCAPRLQKGLRLAEEGDVTKTSFAELWAGRPI
eukprot:s2246_g5.t1